MSEPAQQRGVFRGHEPALRRRRALAVFPDIPADSPVQVQPGAPGIDAHALRRVAVDDIEQVVPAGFGRTGRADFRSRGGRPGPVRQPLADIRGRALVGVPRAAVGRLPRDIPGGEQQGRHVLAVAADRTRAVPVDRNEPCVVPGFVPDRDRIGPGLAARHLAVDPPPRAERGRAHHPAPQIVQPPQIRGFPDRVLDVVRREGRQAGLSPPGPRNRGRPHGRAIRERVGGRYSRAAWTPCSGAIARGAAGSPYGRSGDSVKPADGAA